jgi:prephenate dehydratase
MNVAYFGEPGSYTQKAAILYFSGCDYKLVPCLFIPEVFQMAAKNGGCEFGVVPAENLREGHVGPTYDELFNSDLRIVGEQVVEVKHVAAGIEGAKIKKGVIVRSYNQGLQQVQKFIRENGLIPEESGNTATSARIVAQLGLKNNIAICSEEAAKIHGLKILARGIAEEKEKGPNYTRFYIIQSPTLYPNATPKFFIRDTMAMMFSTLDNPGALNHVLDCFTAQRVNIIDICKRPSQKRTRWHEVNFHIECSGALNDPAPKRVLEMLRNKTPHTSYKITGDYKSSPIAREPIRSAR